ncbi:hypothetical protein HPB47_020568 [Ixodes persulcatus]|uniref:Uncharacterized protein n=1 Tax=Ixodes persulcatus TaxID=34615 RepID=A0AC60QF59_IXOPE|nr:hypothetical protein HPB47_020568 [Ixodes persulcatus]
MSADVVRGLRRVTKISFPLDWGDKTEEKEAFSGAPKDGVPPKLVSRRKSAHGARAAKSEDPGTMTPGAVLPILLTESSHLIRKERYTIKRAGQKAVQQTTCRVGVSREAIVEQISREGRKVVSLRGEQRPRGSELSPRPVRWPWPPSRIAIGKNVKVVSLRGEERPRGSELSLGGPGEFPVRPTASVGRNVAFGGLVEILVRAYRQRV